MKTYLVLGGAGAMGQIIVQDLADTTSDNIIVGDFAFDKADRLNALLDRTNVSKEKVDVHDHAGLVKLIEKSDCVINSTPYYFNTKVMNACLDARRPYLDLGGLFHMTKEQFLLHEKFAAQEIIAICGTGATPGTTNVMAESAARDLDEVESIEIVCGSRDFTESTHPFYPPYMLDTLLDEYTLDAMLFDNGELKAVSPMSGEKTLDFPEPVGRKCAIYTLHSELASMPETYKKKGIKHVSFRLALEPEFHEKLKLLCALGFGTRETVTTQEGSFTPRKLLAHMIYSIPKENGKPHDIEILLVEVKGKVDKKDVVVRMEETAVVDDKRGISAGDLNTGVPPSIMAQMIVRGDVKGKGVFAPELVIEPSIFFNELGKRNIKVRKTINQSLI